MLRAETLPVFDSQSAWTGQVTQVAGDYMITVHNKDEPLLLARPFSSRRGEVSALVGQGLMQRTMDLVEMSDGIDDHQFTTLSIKHSQLRPLLGKLPVGEAKSREELALLFEEFENQVQGERQNYRRKVIGEVHDFIQGKKTDNGEECPELWVWLRSAPVRGSVKEARVAKLVGFQALQQQDSVIGRAILKGRGGRRGYFASNGILYQPSAI